jgi:hypothetical protein
MVKSNLIDNISSRYYMILADYIENYAEIKIRTSFMNPRIRQLDRLVVVINRTTNKIFKKI